MAAPDDDHGTLLGAMGAYQDQQWRISGDHTHPTLVCADWEFHEQHTGFNRDRIRQLLPQLVADGLAQGLGTGMVWGYRSGDGYAWITARGQQQLATWRQPPPPYLAQLEALGPDAAVRLHELLALAAASDLGRQDIDRLAALCQIEPEGSIAPDSSATPASTTHHLDPRLAPLLRDGLLPFLRSIMTP